LIRPIFLAGFRLAVAASGITLTDKVAELRNLMRDEPVALGVFGTRLVHAGFLDGTADRYTRRFSRVGTRMLHVTDGFPRLTRANVAIEIRKVRYEIDLDLISKDDLDLGRALRQLGVIQEWN
jgi:hypothetical protein